MKIRSALHLNGRSRQSLLFAGLQETAEHLVLKLAASVFFFDWEPVLPSALEHPALAGQEFVPDLLSLNEAGELRLWIECGKTTRHKLGKISRRYRDARLVVLTAMPNQGEQQAEEIRGEGLRGLEVWSFDHGEFARWRELVLERNELFGEANETSMNLVLNDQPFLTELRRCL